MFDETKALLALEMRRRGDGYVQIAVALGITEREAIEAVSVTLESQAREDEKVRIQLQLENMERVLSQVIKKAEGGDQQAAERVVKLLMTMDGMYKRLETLRKATLVPAFPAPAQTPGQGQSRNAYAEFIAQKSNCPWWETYLKLRQDWDWRKAAFIAWSVMPSEKRLPSTQHALAVDVLGLKDDRVLRKWRENDPAIEQAIEAARLGMAGDALNDVLAAWTTVAAIPEPSAFNDRIKFLEWKGVYNPKGVSITQTQNVGVTFGAELSDEELEGVIRNLLIVSGELSIVNEGESDG